MKNITCLGCGVDHCRFIFSLGEMPPVNNFINLGEFEKKYPLDLYFCIHCGLVQLGDIVEPSKLFSHYHHTSSASAGNVKHLKSVSELLDKSGFVKDKSILEIGSNDGLLLEYLNNLGADVLGVDPAENLSEEAGLRRVQSLVGFFDEQFAKNLLTKDYKFDTIIALNVMAHTPTFMSALRGVKSLLKKDGIFFMENAYVLDTVLKGQFDTIYHEHVFCFSLHSLIKAYESVGLKIVDAEIIPTQGKSIRVYVRHSSNKTGLSSRAQNILDKESKAGLFSSDSYEMASSEVLKFKEKFNSYLLDNKGVKFVGIGAPARGVVILNYCQVNSENIEFIIDDTPQKQEKLMPGCGIPIHDWDVLDPQRHNKFIILSWNYADDLIGRLREAGCTGTVLLPFPQFKEIIL